MNKLFIRTILLLPALGSILTLFLRRKNKCKLEVAVRALVVKDESLLLVSNDGQFWYTPGGRLNPDEDLAQCVIREVKEETGIEIEPGNIPYVFDFFDMKQHTHKVEIYFSVKIIANIIPQDWSDQDGPVRFAQFFSMNELREINIAPSFLKEGKWLNDNVFLENLYKGHEVQ